MGMIDVTDDFRAAVQNACHKTGMQSARSPALPPAVFF